MAPRYESSRTVYIIGSLRNAEIPKVGAAVRSGCSGWEAFDDWFSAGPEADDHWQKYEVGRGHTYSQALAGHAAKNVYQFDKKHLDRADAGVLVLPAGKSGHLELGYLIGSGKPGFILLAGEPERYDVMYQFATVCTSTEELVAKLNDYTKAK